MSVTTSPQHKPQVRNKLSPLCLLCRVGVSRMPLQRLVVDLLAVSLTSLQQVGNLSRQR